MLKKFVPVAILVIAILGGYLYPKFAPQLAGVPGPELLSPFWSVDGVVHEYRSRVWSGATSTPCSFLSPSSTSTLLFLGFKINNPTSTASIITLATSTVMNATTSLLTNPVSVASAAEATLSYKGTSTAVTINLADHADILPPSSYVTVGVEGFAAYSASEFGGTCQAEFIVN